MVTPTLIERFKERMHITHSAEDPNLEDHLQRSISYVRSKCGEFDVDGDTDIDKNAQTLVIERARYSYNDAIEYFEDNFLSEINSLTFDILLKEGEVNEEI